MIREVIDGEGNLVEQFTPGIIHQTPLSNYVIDPDNRDRSSANDDILSWKVDLVPQTNDIGVNLVGNMLTIDATKATEGGNPLLLFTVSDEEASDQGSGSLTLNSIPVFALPANAGRETTSWNDKC